MSESGEEFEVYPRRMPTEFRIRAAGPAGSDWMVYWWGCDGRAVARCFNRYEASQIARALNETGAAVRWYKRAQVANGMRQEEKAAPARKKVREK